MLIIILQRIIGEFCLRSTCKGIWFESCTGFSFGQRDKGACRGSRPFNLLWRKGDFIALILRVITVQDSLTKQNSLLFCTSEHGSVTFWRGEKIWWQILYSHDVCQGPLCPLSAPLKLWWWVNYPLPTFDFVINDIRSLTLLLRLFTVLFQDVDIVYFKDPLVSPVCLYLKCLHGTPFYTNHHACQEFFQNEPTIQHFDVLFQHDGSNTIRYAPYSANSGF